MSISTKYGRTYHYPFSPGTTSDDRINENWISDISRIKKIIHTEKMDGGNTCENGIGVFARSHAAPSTHPWDKHLKEKHSIIQKDLKDNDIELFGENMYAQHSIIYPRLDSHYYIFAVRQLDMWLSWEEVKWYAEFFEFPTVPELGTHDILITSPNEIARFVVETSKQPSVFGSQQYVNGVLEDCTREGIVTRNVDEYPVNKFKQNVFKYVRKGHVTTDEHWSRNWKRARLIHEY